jgi:hypothetical protein
MTIAYRMGVPYFLKPACFRMLFRVPGASSSFGLPGTVARPGFTGCLNWMTSAGGDQQPAFVSKQPEDLADFHAQDYAPGILPPST